MADASTINARCPRCGAAFHCGMHDAQPCACTAVALDAATLLRLRTRYEGCLCGRCLAAIAREVAPDGARPTGTMPG
ncbi:MAG TPA: cysteine-rich CWC family protein [Burkholderiaceae bacterium]|nr:cysteine-rich CWC family protein [Burkholderiaceae bacterium]